MLTDREVLSTLNMLRNEHLDVRTVTLGISLFDCASHDFDVFAYRVRAKIAKYAAKLVATCNEVGDKFGIPVVNKRISVSPIGVVGASFSRDQMVRACQVLDESAKDAGVDFLGGFGALVEKGITPGERNLIDALPEALATTDRICSSINVASTRSGINMDAVALLGQRILDVAEATRDRDGLGCAKLVVFANIPQDVPFMAGAYLGVGEPDVVINVGVSGPGVVKKAIDRAMESHKPGEFTLGEVAEVIKRTAYKVTRVGEIIGKEVAQRLDLPFGVADLSLAPTPAVGDSVGEIFQSVGLSSIGAPGTTAVLAMLNDCLLYTSLDECRALIDNGAKEITLLGQNVNSYGLDKHASGDTSFARLLRKVSELPGLARLRFVTPHPKDLSPEVIAMFGEVPNLCPRLHLPLQAGSDRVLARMNRKYDMARYMTLVEGLRAARPDIALSTDLIVGFPGETEEQFQETLDAVRAVNFMSSFSFCYSDRPGTAASRHTDKVEPAEKLRRLERLQALQEDLSSDWLKARVGCKTDILLEGASRKQDGEDAATESWQGRDPWGDAVNVSLPAGVGKPGLIVPVIIVTAKKHSLIGELRG